MNIYYTLKNTIETLGHFLLSYHSMFLFITLPQMFLIDTTWLYRFLSAFI